MLIFPQASTERPVEVVAEASGSEGGTEGEDDNVKYVCPVCDAVFEHQHEFTLHIRSHNEASSSSSSSSSTPLNINNNKAFGCSICGKLLSSSSSLDRHMLVHSGERPFKCRICSVSFTTNGNMHRHMRTHNNNTSSVNNNHNHMDSDSSDDASIKTRKRSVRILFICVLNYLNYCDETANEVNILATIPFLWKF